MAAAAAAAVVLSVSSANAQNQQLTLCWAAWDPANAVAEVSKDFTAESGIQMNFEFVPWTNFADRFLNELNSQGKLCDLMIGDSQWLGTSATNDHYVKLNEFFDANGIDINDFLPATVYNYSTWPKGEPEYWALPAMGDALAWIYRKDWFERPEIQEAFQAEYGRALQVPQNWDELLEIAKFFQGREIDGKTRYGVAIYTERGSEDITMGVTSALYQVYGEVLEWAAGRPVIIRTLDAGGDKPIAGLTPEGESNPFLGLRGLRLSLARPEIFTVQLRALARAAVGGSLKVMAPMVSTPAEFEAFRRLFQDAVDALNAEGIEAALPPLGMMVEVPAAALRASNFDADFMSIGSNDLVQYVMAAGRDIASVQTL